MLSILLPPNRRPSLQRTDNTVPGSAGISHPNVVARTNSSSESEQLTGSNVTGHGDPMERFYGIEESE